MKIPGILKIDPGNLSFRSRNFGNFRFPKFVLREKYLGNFPGKKTFSGIFPGKKLSREFFPEINSTILSISG
jgi:hypothetical protein